MKTLFTLALLVIAIKAATDKELWLQFKNTHSKLYESLPEEKLHFEAFKSNVITIAEHNERYNNGEESYFMGINKFSDLTDEEFDEKYLSLMSYEENSDREVSWISPNTKVPDSVDWRDKGAVLSVKDQIDCGSCWAFSTIGALEGQNAIKHNIKEDLSVQELIDCSGKYGNFGCWGGWMDYAYAYIKDHGIASEENYPYEANNLQCRRSNTTRANIKEIEYKDLPNNDEVALKEAIATIGPISVAINATLIRHYAGGVFDNSNCSKGLTHGVLAVGYGTESNQDYYIIKNSWGKTWGDHGYIKMARNKDNQCGIASKPSYPVIA